MGHEQSVLFEPANRLLEKLLGPVTNAPAWWTEGVTIAGLHVAGVAPRGEHGEFLGWIPDHLVMSLLVFLFCAIFFPLASRSYRRDAPGPVQNVIEVFVDFLRDVIKENIPHHGEKYLPIVGGFFFFILLANLCGSFHFLSPPTANLNVTFALSVTCFLFFNAEGIRSHGLVGYLKHFLGPSLVLAVLVFPIEMIGNFARALSLAMRLYGNIYGEHTATGEFVKLFPIVVPWPMNALAIFTALLQAYVFTLLATVYIGGATAHES
jgi:F-type H+-transporting ATPase subunit a